MRLKSFLTALFLLLLIGSSYAQNKKLTYKQVYEFNGPQLTKRLPSVAGWADEENYYYKSEEHNTLFKVNAVTDEYITIIDYKKASEGLPEGFNLQEPADNLSDYSAFIFSKDNDLYYFSLSENIFKKLTNDKDEEKNPAFSPNGKFAAYTKNNDLYAYDIEKETEIRLTNDGTDLIYNGRASWVYYEEILGRSSQYKAFWWSPNSEMISFLRFDDNPVPEFPIYRADGTHGELERQRYPKSGDPNPKVKLGLANVAAKNIIWINKDEEKDRYIAWPFWTPDSKQLLYQWMNRGQDTLIIYSYDAVSGKTKEIYNETQLSWVEFFEDVTFINNGKEFLLRSNKNGYSHLYKYSVEGGLVKRLTSGNWDVDDIHLADEKGKIIFFHGTKNKTTEKHLYVTGYDGKVINRITEEEGSHSCSVAPGGKFYIDRYSNIALPAKVELKNMTGKILKTLGDSKTPEFDKYKLAKTELFTIPSGDGYDLPAIWYLPADFNPKKKYPVIFSIYGGPGSSTVSNSFPYGMSQFYLAQNDIITISVDHRGSGHFGKRGKSLMHRNLSKWEMHDLIAAVKWLKTKDFIDTTKIGITGGSYGGYVTCMALTYGADYFTHGIAHYSVTDWHLYDNVYTERYMDKPKENPEGYKKSSVMAYVNNYKGYLLITHGTMDDNVHMQNTIQFIEELQKQNKDFEVMFYPNQRHGYERSVRPHSVRETVQFWFKHFLGKELNREKD